MSTIFPWPSRKPESPAHKKLTAAAALALDLAQERELTQKHVLFADDDPSFGELVLRWQKQLKMQITWARSNAEIRELLKTRTFDVAILDFTLLNGNSTPIYELLSSKSPKTYVIFITGGSIDEVSAVVGKIGPAPIHNKSDVGNPGFLVNMLRYAGIDIRPGALLPNAQP